MYRGPMAPTPHKGGVRQVRARVRPLITGSQTQANHGVISIIRLLILVRAYGSFAMRRWLRNGIGEKYGSFAMEGELRVKK